MAQDQFRRTEEEYYRLRGRFATGQIAKEQFDAALKALMRQDAQGRWWVIGADDSKWYVHDGQTWVPADPFTPRSNAPPPSLPEPPAPRMTPATPPPPASPSAMPARQPSSSPAIPALPSQVPPSKPRRSGCGGCILPGCIIIVVLVLVIGAGGFLALRSGALTQDNLLNLVGLGPGFVQVDNFRDDAIQVSIKSADTTKDAVSLADATKLNAFDVRSYRVDNPGKYRVEFRTARGNTDLGACVLTMRAGDQYQFVALPERVAVNRANNPSSIGSDYVLSTSSLCR